MVRTSLAAMGIGIAIFATLATIGHNSSLAQQEGAKVLKVTVVDDGKITGAVILRLQGEWTWRSETPIPKPVQQGETITINEHRLSVGFGPSEKKFGLYEYKRFVEITIPSGATLEYRPWEARK